MIMKNNLCSYLPRELLAKDQLLLCHPCHTHLKTKLNNCPAKAYWNNLDPGIIPPELEILTQPEQRLLSRIIPFVKIVKLSGLYGQYGFKGQAILFAYDIFEVTKQLPNMLPRSTNDTSMVIVTENLENLNSIKQYYIL